MGRDASQRLGSYAANRQEIVCLGEHECAWSERPVAANGLAMIHNALGEDGTDSWKGRQLPPRHEVGVNRSAGGFHCNWVLSTGKMWNDQDRQRYGQSEADDLQAVAVCTDGRLVVGCRGFRMADRGVHWKLFLCPTQNRADKPGPAKHGLAERCQDGLVGCRGSTQPNRDWTSSPPKGPPSESSPNDQMRAWSPTCC